VNHYQPLIKSTARSDLFDIPRGKRDELRRVLKDVAATEQPTHHPKIKQLEGQPGLFRVRTGGYRAICALEKPYLLILCVGPRDSVYNNVDELEAPTNVPQSV